MNATPRIALVLLAAALGACETVPPEEDPVQIKLNDLDARMQRFERVVSNQSLVDLDQRVNAVQTEMRTLRGRLEELENTLEALRKQQRDMYSDLERRVGAAQSGGTSFGSGSASGTASGAVGTARGQSSAMEQSQYSAAFGHLKAGNYAAAISGFKQVLADHPEGTLGDNATYWLGEAYYVTRDYPNAAASFQEVLARWPDSRKAPDALLKLGFTQAEMKRNAEARNTLSEVTQRYPDSEAAKLAAERLRRIPR
jgi:tol-pal system protein YbgF